MQQETVSKGVIQMEGSSVATGRTDEVKRPVSPDPETSEVSAIWPNFFIVGAAKAGTTSLCEYLRQHPQIYMSPVKEPHFFSQGAPLPLPRWAKPPILSTDDYLSLFRAADPAKHSAVGEASTSYLWDARTSERLRAQLPSAKIIALLRDPVERAYSHYLNDVREGIMTMSFEEAIRHEMRSSKKGLAWSPKYVELGMYGKQIERYLRHFPRENMLILPFQELVNHPTKLINEVVVFLGLGEIAPNCIKISGRFNAYAAPKNKVAHWILGRGNLRILSRYLVPTKVRGWVRHRFLFRSQDKPRMATSTRLLLQSLYDPDVTKLESLIGGRCDLRKEWI